MHASETVLLAAARGSGQVVPARAQMATTLGSHIILACLGTALRSFVLLGQFIGLRPHDEAAMLLARRWSQTTGVLIAVGAADLSVGLAAAAGLGVLAVRDADVGDRGEFVDEPAGHRALSGLTRPRPALGLGAAACLAAVIIGRCPARCPTTCQPNGDS